MRIDAVITWVDGADPAHRAARARYRSGDGDGGEGRYVQSGEIYVALASILKYAPFIDRIFVVTDGQVPRDLDRFEAAGICAPGRIRIVDHDMIFAGLPAARPNFNSRSIEAAIHRIPGLSESFVYLNDDMLLNRPARPEDFFRDGRPRLQGEMRRSAAKRVGARAKAWLRRIANRPDRRPSHLFAQETAARMLGFEGAFLRVPHKPHPLRVSTIADTLDRLPGALDRQVGFRFRDRAQYLPVALANHAEMRLGAAVAPPPDLVYLRDRRGADFDGDLARIVDGSAQYACIQGLEALDPDRRGRVLEALARKFASHLPDPIRARLHDPSDSPGQRVACEKTSPPTM